MLDKKFIISGVVKALIDLAQASEKKASDAQRDAIAAPTFTESATDTTKTHMAEAYQKFSAEARRLRHEAEVLSNLDLESRDAVSEGSIFCLSAEGDSDQCYFLLPFGAGISVPTDEAGEQTVTVATPVSPLGQAVLGKKRGDKITLPTGKEVLITEIF